MGPEQDNLRQVPPWIKGKRSGIDIETDLKKLMAEYLEYCEERSALSFQGAISEMAWEVEHDPDAPGHRNT